MPGTSGGDAPGGARERPATIEDVASLAGVSRAAVSKVIRDAYGVSDAMRDRVGAAIEELGYRPRVAARAMRGSTYTIGVQLPQLDNGFFTRILSGVVSVLRGSGYQIIVAPMTDGGSGTQALENLADRQVDGIIAVAPGVQQSWLEQLGRRIPLVQVGQHQTPERYDVVTSDDVVGAGLVMDHLLGLGHTRIIHLTTDEKDLMEPGTDPHRVRAKVYVDRMTARGLQPEVLHVDDSDDHVGRTTRSVLERQERPTALFAGHDMLAMEVLRTVSESGLRPEDFAVVGYDDIPLADHPLIGLSTVDQSGHRMGATAAELLLERMGGRTTAVRYQTSPVLRVRRSSASTTDAVSVQA